MIGLAVFRNQNRCGVYFFAFILNTFGLRLSDKNDVCWEFNLIPYKLSSGFTPYQHDYIKQQIAKINSKTCLTWSNITETENLRNATSYVLFNKSRSPFGPCETTIYFPSDEGPLRALITLADACFEDMSILHEMVHALGFVHEHMRIDRDCYVWISEVFRRDPNFAVYPPLFIPNIDRFPYDKRSIMHYTRSNIIKSRSERWYEWEPLGNEEEHLTELDLWKIQYRFCGRPHYCDVHPQHCRQMEQIESEMNCNVGAPYRY